MKRDHEKEPVVAVCGSTAFVYGPKGSSDRRPLIRTKQFPHYGAARLFAQEFEDDQTPSPSQNNAQKAVA